eukprot:6207426-Pleurochrysis_carterae.AAC.1
MRPLCPRTRTCGARTHARRRFQRTSPHLRSVASSQGELDGALSMFDELLQRDRILSATERAVVIRKRGEAIARARSAQVRARTILTFANTRFDHSAL